MQEKHKDDLKGLRSHRDIEKEKVFTIKDLDEISYRQLNDWDKKGLLRTCQRDNENSWRKFSVLDMTLLNVIKDLKKCLYSDVAINHIIDQMEVALQTVSFDLFKKNDETFYTYIVACSTGMLAIGRGKDTLIDFHKEISSNSGLGENLLKEGMLIIPLGLYYRTFFIKYYKKQLEIGKKSDVHPLNSIPECLRKMVLIELIQDENYKEILIKRKSKDFIIKPKCTTNKLSIYDVIKILLSSKFENIEIKTNGGNTIFLTKEETIKI